jgi:hypothetical protein
MPIFELTTTTNEDGSTIVRAAGRISDHPASDEQSEWIAFQISIEQKTVLNGALLRSKVLEQVAQRIQTLAREFEQLGRGR